MIYRFEPSTLRYVGALDVAADEVPRYMDLPGYAEDAPAVTAGSGEEVYRCGSGWAVRVSQIVPAEPPAPQPPSPERTEARYAAAVQSMLDARARSFGYDDIRSAVTYADEPAVARFQAEGQAFRAWRSLVWARCYELQAEIRSETRALPTLPDFLSVMPEFSL